MRSSLPATPAARSNPGVAAACAALIAVTLVLGFATRATAATFDPLNVIPYETWRASSSLSAAGVQAFLDTQPGVLKSLVTSDYAGRKKRASLIIYEAARAWNLNPKIVLCTLQKEQSLLTAPSPSAATLRKAMGCGIYKGSPNTFPGFGNQVWNGTRKLSTYEIQFNWVPGMTKKVYSYPAKKSVNIVPKNASTFALYTYTPYYPQKLVWDIHMRYFGDPQTSPRLRPVYRFKNRSNGSFLYTSSEVERYRYVKRYASTYRFEGVGFTVDTSATPNSTPLYRLYRPASRRWTYTRSASTRDALIKKSGWRLSSIVCRVSLEHTGTAVFRLTNKKTGGTLYTTSVRTRTALASGRSAPYTYRGIDFWLAKSVASTAPVGPPTP